MTRHIVRPVAALLLAAAFAGIAGCAAAPAAPAPGAAPAAADTAHRPQTPAEAFLNCHRRRCT